MSNSGFEHPRRKEAFRLAEKALMVLQDHKRKWLLFKETIEASRALTQPIQILDGAVKTLGHPNADHWMASTALRDVSKMVAAMNNAELVEAQRDIDFAYDEIVAMRQ